ncbi:hypothetical protein [Hymenobacter cellulosilyticus]|uniref:XRE family transcriptional regulator n=1 Tax=Hymenobacter cellulosilyticus TaxID=2932248 RepID=A0A8T9Q7X0_9BACT|nr:hypothetical protein [Hymenobacter cellulosilyticus]UOQ71113.1 hypothetical protein MUN79_20945 [Hymenobacter cellulosilyticus]
MVATGTVGQRFTQLIAHLGISKNAFASSLEKTATVIQHIVDERNKPGFDLLCKVFEVYPNVSKDWLLQGTGTMMVSGSSLPVEPSSAAPAPRQVAAKMQSEATVASPQPAAETVPPRPLVAAAVAPEPAPAGAAQPQPQPQPSPVEPTSLAAPSIMPSVVQEAAIEIPVVPPATVNALPFIAPAPTPVPTPAPTQTDTSWQTALYTQQMAHQLAMAELRNQHLQEQQRMMQQMMDLMKQQMFK